MMMRTILTVVMSTIALVLASPVWAENWPQFRGPNGQGVSSETNLPLAWNADSNIAWKTEIPGQSWSSPIVWDDRVFVVTATDNGTSCRVLALDTASGKIVWNTELFEQALFHKEGRNSYATPTPVTDGQLVYACFGDGSFAALDLHGNVTWTNRDYPFYSQHGLATSPIRFRDLLIMARDGSSDGDDKTLGWQKPWDRSYIVALDADSGRHRWTAKRGFSRIAHGVPAIWTAPDGHAILISEAGDVVQGFDAELGGRIWTSEVIGEGKVPSVVLGDGVVFTAGGFGGRDSIKAFRLGGRGDLKETNLVWEQAKGMPKVPSMIYVRPYLFAITDNGVATCMQGDTGQIVWQKRLAGNYSASPVAADGHIYFLSDEGETTVINAGPEFKILARNPLSEHVQASMAVSQRRLFIRTEQNLYCIGEK
jgi:outer membrane protein assembly factor BamB